MYNMGLHHTFTVVIRRHLESETDKSETEKSKLDVGDVQLSVDVGDVQASEVRCWRSPDLQMSEQQQLRHLVHLPVSLQKVEHLEK